MTFTIILNVESKVTTWLRTVKFILVDRRHPKNHWSLKRNRHHHKKIVNNCCQQVKDDWFDLILWTKSIETKENNQNTSNTLKKTYRIVCRSLAIDLKLSGWIEVRSRGATLDRWARGLSVDVRNLTFSHACFALLSSTVEYFDRI